AFTDSGRAVALFENDPPANSKGSPSETELEIGRKALLRVLRVAKPDPKYDCHGWVFTGGQFWGMSTSVDDILTANVYARVLEPRLGDLVVFRDRPDGTVMHSGIVQSVTGPDVLVESKWGNLGRYLHAPADQPFGKSWTFYRSPRAGHQLRISPSP